MLLKDLISRKKILFDLLKDIPEKLLNNNVSGISVNSKEVKKNTALLPTPLHPAHTRYNSIITLGGRS